MSKKNKILFDLLQYEEDATYYNHCVYRLPEEFDLEECTHILVKYDGGEELEEVSIGVIGADANAKLRYIRKKHIHHDAYIYQEYGMIKGIVFDAETKLVDTNPLT